VFLCSVAARECMAAVLVSDYLRIPGVMPCCPSTEKLVGSAVPRPWNGAIAEVRARPISMASRSELRASSSRRSSVVSRLPKFTPVLVPCLHNTLEEVMSWIPR
jgi:hypothetical protein